MTHGGRPRLFVIQLVPPYRLVFFHISVLFLLSRRRCYQVDLRSGKELGKDELIHGDVYEGFVNVGGGEYGGTGVWEGPEWDEAVSEESVGAFLEGTSGEMAGKDQEGSRRRYFVSLIDESIYKKGVFQRLRRRHKVRALDVLAVSAQPFSGLCMTASAGDRGFGSVGV